MSIDLITPIGLPPAAYTTSEIVYSTMPIARIWPAEPQFQPGMTLFRMNRSKGTDEYLKLLDHYGYSVAMPLELAFLADNFPTDTFANTYGESFLQKATDVVSQASGEISQMMGASNAREAVQGLSKSLKDSDSDFAKGIGQGIQSGQKAISDILNVIAPKDSRRAGAVQTMNQMLAGARIDFPQVWKNSGFSPSYTMTVRLYNPNPASLEATEKYIIGPLVAILLLGIPRTEDGSTYNWPFLHTIKSPGIYNLDPAFISNITVVKGGDQQSISFNQRLAIVDVRIDFGSLYNSMMAGMKDDPFRPNLKQYIDGMKEEVAVAKGTFYGEPDGTQSSNPTLADSSTVVGQTVTPVDTDSDPPSRINSDVASLNSALKARNEREASGFINTSTLLA